MGHGYTKSKGIFYRNSSAALTVVSSPHEGLDRGDNTRPAGAGAGVSGCVSTSGPSEVTVGTARIRADILVIFDLKTDTTQEWSVNCTRVP